MNTLKDVTEYILNLVQNNALVKGSDWGLLQRLEIDPNKLYPYVYLIPNSSEVNISDISVTYNMIVMDLLNFDYTNENDIISDCMEINHQILSSIDRNNILGIANVSMVPFTNRGLDNTAGCTSTFTITYDKPYSDC